MELKQVTAFYENRDENGIRNADKIEQHQKIIRRIASTDKNKSVEAVEGSSNGMVLEDGKLIGFGIHIFNEDVYPLQSFEIYLRDCDLTGDLNLKDCEDLVFLDVYRNRISSVQTGNMPAMRIFGIQGNRIETLDVSGMPACQGIDAGKNLLSELDVSQNPELVELYINDNRFTEIDLSNNPKLKYFYCHNNQIRSLDARSNPLLRHVDATGNPMKEIRMWAPQREDRAELSLTAGEGGSVGLRCNPVYNAQWKETGEWQQAYFAYPEEGYELEGWFDETENCLSKELRFMDVYGTGRILHAVFSKTI